MKEKLRNLPKKYTQKFTLKIYTKHYYTYQIFLRNGLKKLFQ